MGHFIYNRFAVFVVVMFACSLFSACGSGSSTGPTSSHVNSSLQKSSAVSRSSVFSSRSSASTASASSQKFLLNYGNNSMQKAELRLPVVETETLSPVVVIIHGGCWVSSFADYHIMDDLAVAITDAGYATWNIEYRGIGTGGEWPVIFQDVGQAIDYLRVVAQTYPIDINRVVVVGHSAGGHLALWAASRKKIDSDSVIYSENSLTLHGVLSLAGIANLTAMNTSCGNFASSIINMPINEPSNNLVLRLKESSPFHMLPTGVNSVIISGGVDGIVPASIGESYSNAASAAGDSSVHYVLPGLGHFDLIQPAQTDWTLYVNSLRELLRD